MSDKHTPCCLIIRHIALPRVQSVDDQQLNNWTQMLSSFSAPFLRWPVEFHVHIQKFCLRSVSHCVYPKCGVHFFPHKSIFFIFSINALFTFMFTLAVFFFLGFVGGVSMCITRHRIIPNSKSIQSSLCCCFPALINLISGHNGPPGVLSHSHISCRAAKDRRTRRATRWGVQWNI